MARQATSKSSARARSLDATSAATAGSAQAARARSAAATNLIAASVRSLGRDGPAEGKGDHAVASALLGERQRRLGAPRQSVDAFRALVQARRDAEAHGDLQQVACRLDRDVGDGTPDAARDDDGA